MQGIKYYTTIELLQKNNPHRTHCHCSLQYGTDISAILKIKHRNILMDSLLHSAAGALGRWVHSLNPSLMEDTPPFKEVTGSDVCFLGPNGESDDKLVIFCRDFTMRSLVGSWYLSPTRHGLEMLILSPIFVLVIWKILPSLMQLESSRSVTKTDHPLGIPTMAASCMSAHLMYKTLGKKLLFLCVPCNVQWQLTVLVCFGNWSGPVQGVLYQLLLSYW